MGPQAHHRPVELQQGLFLREGLLPVLRHRARRQAEEGQGRRRKAVTCRLARAGACRKSARLTASSSPASAAPASSPSAACSAWRRISKARASASSTWPGSRRRAARSTATSASPTSRKTSTPSAWRRAAPISCSAAISWSPATRRCWQRSSTARPRSSSISLNSCPATSRATPISRCRPSGSSAPSSARPARDNVSFHRRHAACDGAAWQLYRRQHFHGRLCLSERRACRFRQQAIEQAIELNGEAVAMNQAAFRWGRRAAVDAAAVEKLVPLAAEGDDNRRLSQSFDEIVARRVAFLTDYQNAAYAQRYRDPGRARAAGGEPTRRRASRGLPRRWRAICSS